MNIREFLADDRFLTADCREGRAHKDPKVREIMADMAMRRAVKCADGFVLSMQFSPFHYCNAREPLMGGEWAGRGTPWPEPKSIEIGFPSRREPLLKEYAEEWRRPTKTVYGWVPLTVVDEVLAKHGGISHVRSENFRRWEAV